MCAVEVARLQPQQSITGRQRVRRLIVAAVGVLASACSAINEPIPSPTATIPPRANPVETPAEVATPYVVPAEVNLPAPAEEAAPGGPSDTPAPGSGFDPAYPYQFCQDDRCVDFLNPASMTVGMAFSEAEMTVNPILNDPAVPVEQSLPACSQNLLVTNARDGASESEVWYKVVIYAHSGNCRGEWHPAEYFRDYLEGGYLTPSDTQRTERLAALQGQILTFDQGDGPVAFEIVDIAYLTPEQVEQDYIPNPGSLDRFFTTGIQDGVHEVFWVFCGSVGLARPDNPFATRYILRLQVAASTALP